MKCPNLSQVSDITGQVTVDRLRQAIDITLQTPFLSGASIGENIVYGNLHTNQQESDATVRVVQMLDFVPSLPLSYGTSVGELGATLSGEQPNSRPA